MKKFLSISIFVAIISSLHAQDVPDAVIKELSKELGEDVGKTDNNFDKDFSIDSSNLTDNNQKKQESNIFGHDYIKTMPTSITGSSDLPLPSDYIISLKDTLKIVFSGNKQEVLRVKVGLDGAILLPEIGKLNIAGFKFSEAKDKIQNLIEISYVGVRVDISLEEISAKKISIVGAVKAPGTYLVNPFTSLSNLLAYAGGLEEYSSLRNLILIRGQQRIIFDLYELLIFGDRINDMMIQPGDTLLVQPTKNLVSLEGEVLRPLLYEYNPEDTFADLINFALGFTNLANSENIFIEERVGKDLIRKNISLSEVVGDRIISKIFVNKQSTNKQLGIQVLGSAVKQTFIENNVFDNFSDLLDSLQFSDEIYPFYATASLETEDGLLRESFSFSIRDKKTYIDKSLRGNVQINFFSRDEIDSYQESFTDLLNQEATSETDNFQVEEDLEVENNEMNYIESNLKSDQFRITDIKLISFGDSLYFLPLVGEISPKDIFKFFGNNQDLIEEKVTITTRSGLVQNAYSLRVLSSKIVQINFPQEEASSRFLVEISGLVNNPGVYSVTDLTTLEELYQIAGGMANKADHNAIILTRERLKIREKKSFDSAKKLVLDTLLAQLGNPLNPNSSSASLLEVFEIAENIDFSGRLSGNISPGSLNAKKITLEPGDQVYIPALSNSISILGEVLQPSTVTYKDQLTYDDYIKISGGYTTYADKRNIYVIRSDGTSLPISQNNLRKEVPQFGDTLIIPRDVDRISTVPLISTSVKIISDIAFAAASLNILRN